MKPTFPTAAVIDAASRNAQLQEQARQAGNQSLIQGLQAIGNIGNTLYDTKMRVAQAMAGAKMYAQTPEGQQMLGTNQVTSTPESGPVTMNQTAAYDPTTGSVTSNQSPVTIKDIANSMLGMEPKDIAMQRFLQSKQSQDNALGQGELALKQKTEPQKIQLDAELRKLLLGVNEKNANTAATHTENEDVSTLLARRDSLLKNLSILPDFLSPGSSESQKEIDRIDELLAKKGHSMPGKVVTPNSQKYTSPGGASYSVISNP